MGSCLEKVIASVTRISFLSWGNSLIIEGLNDPVEQKKYCVTYKNCKLISWEMVEDDEAELSSDCVSLIFWETGEGHHRTPAIITTSFFEISILYESYEILETTPL